MGSPRFSPLRTADGRPVGVVIALPAEARSLRASGAARYLDLELTGPGPARAGIGAQALVARGAGALMSWGTSGALWPTLEPGRVLIAEAVRDAAGVEYASMAEWRDAACSALASLHPLICLCCTVEIPLGSSSSKAELAARTGCAAVDMEAAAVAGVAATNGLPFLAVRSVVDPVSFNLPACALSALDDSGKTSISALLSALLRHPQELPALLKLALHFRRALRSLHDAAVLFDRASGARPDGLPA